MKGIERARRVLISAGQRRLSSKIPEEIRTNSCALRIWNILEEKAIELIRIGFYGTDEEVREMFSMI